MDRTKETDRYSKLISTVKYICIGLVLVTAALEVANLRLLGDDLWYSTFAKHGLSDFIESLTNHYHNVNGRTMIHGLLALVLALGDPISKAFHLVILTLTMLFVVRCTRVGNSQSGWLFIISLAVFLLIGDNILTETILWYSGFFNYIIPALFLLIYMDLLKSVKQVKYQVLAVVIGALSAFTTELNSLITLTVTVILLIKYRRTREMRIVCVLSGFINILGLYSLLSSGGIGSRFTEYGSGGGFFEKCMICFTTFSQMGWERNGMAFVLMLSSMLCGAAAVHILKNKFLAVAAGVIFAASLLSIGGVVIPAYLGMILYLLCAVLLAVYGIMLMKKRKDVIVIISAISFVVSACVICASGVSTYRMLFMPAFFLFVIAIRSFAILKIDERKTSVIAVVMCVLAVFSSLHVCRINRINSETWDENQAAIESYDGSGVLVLKNSPEELYFKSAFQDYFIHYYLNEYGIGADTEVILSEDEYFSAINKNGAVVSDQIVERNGEYYIYCRDLANCIGADVGWAYGTANFQLGNDVYRFKSGASAAITAYVGGWSRKLENPVRSIDDRIYISVDDANLLFGADLRVE